MVNLYMVILSLKAFNRLIFEVIRERSSVISSGSHFNLFHNRCDLPLKPFGLVSKLQYFSSIFFNSTSTL